MASLRNITCLTVLLLSTFYITLSAQQKLNLNFEQLSVEEVARPWGWSVFSFAPEVSFICDSIEVFSGDYCLKINANQTQASNRFELSFFIETNQILSSKVSIQAWAKSESFSGKAGVKLTSVGAVGDEFGTLEEVEINITDSKNWKQYSSKINIDERSHSLLVTLFFEGMGTVWFDDLQLKINGEKVNEVAVAEDFTKIQIDQLKKETFAFRTVEPTKKAKLEGSSFEDFQKIKSIIGDAKIIALGESTHGTSEFFKVKHRFLQYAVLELGVRVFILEDNQLLVEKINDYVLYGKGKAEEVIKGLFAVWNTAEMLELIKWVRSYNIANPNKKVEFVGMDVQNPQLALEHLNDFLLENDSLLQRKAYELLTDIREGWRNSFFQSDSTLTKWDRQAGVIYDLVEHYREKWLRTAKSQADRIKIEWAVQNARVIKQFVEAALGGVYEGRDKAMAENVEWVINQRKAGTKVVIWAHDSHIGRGDHPDAGSNYFFGQSMGSYLSKTFKDDYRALGLFTYQGTCLGTVSYSNFKQIPFDIYTSPRGSLDEALHKISLELEQENLILNLRPFKNDLAEYIWISKKRPVRYVGYVAEDYGFGGRYSIPYQFDGIIFIDKSNATRKIKK